MTRDPILASISLTEGDLEQAIEVDRLSLDGVCVLLGLHEGTENLTTSFLLLERLKHADTGAQVRVTLRAMGEARGEKLRFELRHLICEEWGYCGQRAVKGFGDRRTVFREICDLIAPTILGYATPRTPRERMLIILAAAYISRRSLDALCMCDG